MHALLKLVQSKDDAKRLLAICDSRDICLASKQHGEELTAQVVENGGFSVSHGSYGSKITLGIGKDFAAKWEPTTKEELFDSKKPFANLTVAFHESVPQLECESVGVFIAKNGGVLSTDGGVDLWIHALKAKDAPGAIPDGVPRTDLNSLLDAFPRAAKALEKMQEETPVAKSGKPKKAKITPEQIAAFEEIKQLLSEDDLAKVNEGLLRARELSDHLDHLLSGLKIKDGEISEAGLYRQLGWKSHRDFIVCNLLSMASSDSKAAKFRSQITKLRLSPPPVLKGFDGLESLKVGVHEGGHLISNDLRLEDGFKQCSEFPSLLSLDTSIPLDGLVAPALENLTLRSNQCSSLKCADIPPSVSRLAICDVPTLSDLEILKGNQSIQRIYITNCPDLRDISMLSTLPALAHAVIKAEIDVPPTEWPGSLVHLEAEKWTSDLLGRLPAGLKHFSLGACTGIKNLQCIEHCKEPFSEHSLGEYVMHREKIVNVRSNKEGDCIFFDFESGDYSSTGVGPAGYLSLDGCQDLVSLEGLHCDCGLKQIRLPSHPIDVSVLAEMPNVVVIIGKRSEAIIQSLSCLSNLKLQICDWKCNSLQDLEFLAPLFSNLLALDLSRVSTVKDVSAVMNMEKLAELKIDGRAENPAMIQLKKSRFTSRGQIDALKLKFMAGA
jgi:hypothetical protein